MTFCLLLCRGCQSTSRVIVGFRKGHLWQPLFAVCLCSSSVLWSKAGSSSMWVQKSTRMAAYRPSTCGPCSQSLQGGLTLIEVRFNIHPLSRAVCIIHFVFECSSTQIAPPVKLLCFLSASYELRRSHICCVYLAPCAEWP